MRNITYKYDAIGYSYFVGDQKIFDLATVMIDGLVYTIYEEEIPNSTNNEYFIDLFVKADFFGKRKPFSLKEIIDHNIKVEAHMFYYER